MQQIGSHASNVFKSFPRCQSDQTLLSSSPTINTAKLERLSVVGFSTKCNLYERAGLAISTQLRNIICTAVQVVVLLLRFYDLVKTKKTIPAAYLSGAIYCALSVTVNSSSPYLIHMIVIVI
jgi:hypothetical protein